MSNNKSPKALILVALVVVALGGGATYFQYNAAQAVKAEVADLEQQVPSQQDLEASLAESHAQLQEYQQKLAHLESSVPDVAYIPTLMKELEQMGKAHGITVTGVRPTPQVAGPTQPQEGKKEKKKDYVEVEIEIKGRGRYENIRSLLGALEQFPKVIAVKTVGLSPFRDSGMSGSDQLECTVNLVAFVFPFEPSQLPAAARPVVTEPGKTDPAGAAPAQTGAGEPVNTAASSLNETLKVAKKGGR